MKDQRSNGAATSNSYLFSSSTQKKGKDPLPAQFTNPVSYLSTVIQTSIVLFGQLMASSALTPNKPYYQNMIKRSHNTLQLLIHLSSLLFPLPTSAALHGRWLIASCGLKCNPTSSSLLHSMNSHNLFTGSDSAKHRWVL